jgi:hypothetical protein
MIGMIHSAKLHQTCEAPFIWTYLTWKVLPRIWAVIILREDMMYEGNTRGNTKYSVIVADIYRGKIQKVGVKKQMGSEKKVTVNKHAEEEVEMEQGV